MFWNCYSHNALSDVNRKCHVAMDSASYTVGYNVSPVIFSLHFFSYFGIGTLKYAKLTVSSSCLHCVHGCTDNQCWASYMESVVS